MIIDFIRERREADKMRWGVEPICQVLRDHGIEIAPSTSYQWRDKLPSGASSAMRPSWSRSAGPTRPTVGIYGEPQGLAAAQPRGHPSGALHGETAHA